MPKKCSQNISTMDKDVNLLSFFRKIFILGTRIMCKQIERSNIIVFQFLLTQFPTDYFAGLPVTKATILDFKIF